MRVQVTSLFLISPGLSNKLLIVDRFYVVLAVNMVLNVHRNRTAYREGGGRGYGGGWRGRLYTYHYTVTTRMIPALRWAAMRAILMFH